MGAEGYFLKPLEVPKLVNRMMRIIEQLQPPPQRVLIVDDDTVLAERYRLVLRGAGMDATILNSAESLIETLASFRPELVLMDLYMPDYTGQDLAALIRQYDCWVSLPIVYLSAETDFDLQIAAMGRGADDFLTKPVSDTQLIAAVRARIARGRQLDEQITKDGLTGLLKHTSIKEAAAVAVAHTRRTGRPVTLAMIDIDHFKLVNDSYGHATGDVVIATLAMLLRQRLRQSDIIGRYGGEEFVAVLTECDATAAYQRIDAIRQHFSAVRITHEGQEFCCNLSAGIACVVDHPDSSSADLLIAADEALYIAKRNGRNQVQIAAGKPLQEGQP